ncbi:hypothetical protein AMS68_006331 [Peltaster fructicola]|uniref:C2H2-type domain-containing protein n=1 Tax=Peltaster fructicola TaxID=286661 RepID=A0A6H0Y1D4_9PEZI|nr:hypothetical protein AMS68_006331 [Peltaster fructicola]
MAFCSNHSILSRDEHDVAVEDETQEDWTADTFDGSRSDIGMPDADDCLSVIANDGEPFTGCNDSNIEQELEDAIQERHVEQLDQGYWRMVHTRARAEQQPDDDILVHTEQLLLDRGDAMRLAFCGVEREAVVDIDFWIRMVDNDADQAVGDAQLHHVAAGPQGLFEIADVEHRGGDVRWQEPEVPSCSGATETETGEKPWQCRKCHTRWFSRKKMLRCEEIGLGLKAFTCEICARSFRRKDHLTRHMRTVKCARPSTSSLPESPLAEQARPVEEPGSPAMRHKETQAPGQAAIAVSTELLVDTDEDMMVAVMDPTLLAGPVAGEPYAFAAGMSSSNSQATE